jgi:hypothetical protein
LIESPEKEFGTLIKKYKLLTKFPFLYHPYATNNFRDNELQSANTHPSWSAISRLIVKPYTLSRNQAFSTLFVRILL